MSTCAWERVLVSLVSCSDQWLVLDAATGAHMHGLFLLGGNVNFLTQGWSPDHSPRPLLQRQRAHVPSVEIWGTLIWEPEGNGAHHLAGPEFTARSQGP